MNVLFPVVPRGEPPLPQHPHHPCRHQARPARRQGDYREAEGAEAGPHHLPPGLGHGQRDRGRQVPRVLGPHPEGPEERVRRGHPGRAVPAAQAKEEEALQAALTQLNSALSVDGLLWWRLRGEWLGGVPVGWRLVLWDLI